MRVKTFQGRTLEEVLPEIRSELGSGAVVLGQRQVVQGGVGGFFGKKMVEVTAADRMPSDTELVDLEDRIMGRTGSEESPDTPDAGQLIDMTDSWDGGLDDAMPDHVAAAFQRSYGESAGYEPLEPPRRNATVNAAVSAYAPKDAVALQGAIEDARAAIVGGRTNPMDASVNGDDALQSDHVGEGPVFVAAKETPQQQARRLAAQAHEAIAAATREIEHQIAASGSRTIHLSVNEPARVEESTTGTTTLRAQVASVDQDATVIAPRVSSDAPAVPTVSESDPQKVRAGLFAAGVDHDIADVLINQIATHRLPFSASRDVRELAREVVAETVRVETGWPALGRTHRIAFVGASGSGKSSSVAKLAEGYTQSGMRVGVISVIAGSTSTANLAAHANDPLVRRGTVDIQFAADPTQMITAVERFSDRDVVLIDTPSSAYLEPAAFQALAACLTAVRIDDVQVVVPLAVSVREAESVVDHFRPLGVKHMIVTKLDESRYAGQLLNFGYRFGVPITFLSDGPRVPEDIRTASAREIAALIVPQQDAGE